MELEKIIIVKETVACEEKSVMDSGFFLQYRPAQFSGPSGLKFRRAPKKLSSPTGLKIHFHNRGGEKGSPPPP